MIVKTVGADIICPLVNGNGKHHHEPLMRRTTNGRPYELFTLNSKL